MTPSLKDFKSAKTQRWLEDRACLTLDDKIRGYCGEVEYDEETLRKELAAAKTRAIIVKNKSTK